MAKNDHSKFFLAIIPKKTGINSEWPKIVRKKFGLAIFGHSKFISVIRKFIRKNLEWPFYFIQRNKNKRNMF